MTRPLVLHGHGTWKMMKTKKTTLEMCETKAARRKYMDRKIEELMRD